MMCASIFRFSCAADIILAKSPDRPPLPRIGLGDFIPAARVPMCDVEA